MKLDVNDIIIKPVVSEKSTLLQEEDKYTFYVHPKANKKMVSSAIKQLFDVTPVKVAMIRTPRKLKRVRYNYGYTASKKKAIITLEKGQKIEEIHMG